MYVIKARNVHTALPEAIHYLSICGRTEESRNGMVIRSPESVTTVYTHPRERVLFWPERDANPFFHFYEGLWMLGGREDVASLTRFVKRMSDYSDNGTTFHGAYGYRWMTMFGLNQPVLIGEALRADPTCRRQVLQIWNVTIDLVGQKYKRDVPCNLVATFQVNQGALDMNVFCRSNDAVWGCYGANAVHFSMLQEFIASVAQVPVGVYEHTSVNWHAYEKVYKQVLPLAQYAHQPVFAGSQPSNPYQEQGSVSPFRMVNTSTITWLQDLDVFLDAENGVMGYRDVFFRKVALPIVAVHNMYKLLSSPERYTTALIMCQNIKASDWRKACEEWLQRRYNTWQQRT